MTTTTLTCGGAGGGGACAHPCYQKRTGLILMARQLYSKHIATGHQNESETINGLFPLESEHNFSDMEISKLVTYGLIVTFLVLLTVGDTVLIAILMYCFNRNNPPNCDYQCSGNLTCDSVRSNLFVFMPFYRISPRCCVCSVFAAF